MQPQHKSLLHSLVIELRRLLVEQEADLGLISEKARENQFVDMFDVMSSKVKNGMTTTSEAVRILGTIRQN